MRLLPLLTGNQLDGILLTGNTLPRLPLSSGLTIGQKVLRRSLTLVHRKVHCYAWYNRVWDSDKIITF